MGILKKAVAAFIIMVFFTSVFAFFNSLGVMQARIGSSLYFLVFLIWVFLEVIFSTM